MSIFPKPKHLFLMATLLSTLPLHVLSGDGVPLAIRELFDKRYPQLLEETRRCIKNAATESDRFQQVLLAINRGVLIKGKTTLQEVKTVFGDRIKRVASNDRDPSVLFTIGLQSKYHFYSDYEHKSVALKGVAYWDLNILFSREGILEDYWLQISD